jgi:hypothetical protein
MNSMCTFGAACFHPSAWPETLAATVPVNSFTFSKPLPAANSSFMMCFSQFPVNAVLPET